MVHIKKFTFSHNRHVQIFCHNPSINATSAQIYHLRFSFPRGSFFFLLICSTEIDLFRIGKQGPSLTGGGHVHLLFEVGGHNIFYPPDVLLPKYILFIDIHYTITRITCHNVTRDVQNFQSKVWPTSRFVCIDISDMAKILV